MKKICDSKENINVKVIDENIKENDQPYRKIENINSQSNVSKNDTPIDDGKVNTCHQGTLPSDSDTVVIQNIRSKCGKTDFKHKHSEQVVIRENINVKVIDESIKENDQPYRKIENIKGHSTNVSENDTPTDDDKVDACHQRILLSDSNTVRIQNIRSKFEKQIFSYLFHKKEMD